MVSDSENNQEQSGQQDEQGLLGQQILNEQLNQNLQLNAQNLQQCCQTLLYLYQLQQVQTQQTLFGQLNPGKNIKWH